MGEASRSVSSSGLRLLLRLVSVVAALVVLCVAQDASAAMVAVGMCSDHGETVEAPPVFRAVNDDGTISALPCRGPSELGTGQSAPLAPERVIVHERPERVLGFGALCITQSESSRMPVADARVSALSPGFVSALFRPPRH